METKIYGSRTMFCIVKEMYQGTQIRIRIKFINSNLHLIIPRNKMAFKIICFDLNFRAIFTAMVYNNGVKRPLVRGRNDAGLQRVITR